MSDGVETNEGPRSAPFPAFPVDEVNQRGARAHCSAVDAWLRELLAAFDLPRGVALVALGGYGRGEMFPHSDLDLLLASKGKGVPGNIAQAIWYPIWDAGLKLGHSVRSMKDTLRLARDDLDTATALLDVRTILGDDAVTDELRRGAQEQWRKGASTWLVRLGESVAERGTRCGEVAFDLEPDLKNGRGGLRDVHTLRWVRLAQGLGSLDDPELDAAVSALSTARAALHLCSPRPSEQISVELREQVARRAGSADGDALIAAVTSAARVVNWQTDEAFGDVTRRRKELPRAWDVPGVVRVGERVALAPDGDHDAVAFVRLATASARTDRRMVVASLLRAMATPVPDPWPPQLSAAVVELLSLGRAAIPAIESLDHLGAWVMLMPEWAPARSRPQHNPYHRYTVDRHLLEAVSFAAALDSDRRDLLLWGALLHDLGKAYPGDHSTVGGELAETILRRAGFDEDDVATVVMMVREHLLLPDTATRRDLDDPSVLVHVASRVGRMDRLQLLAKLSVADGRATGSTAWSPWKASLVGDLVARVAEVLEGRAAEELVVHPTLDPAELDGYDVGSGAPRLVIGEGGSLRVMTADRPGLFSRISGALALHGLDIRQARAGTVEGVAVEDLEVESSFGVEIPWEAVCADLRLAITGGLAISARLSHRAAAYPSKEVPHSLQPAVRVLDGHVPHRSVVEVVGPDSIGLLYRLTCTLAELDLDISKAMVTTLGTDVVDVFYVESRSALDLSTERARSEIRLALLHALAV